ncbi:hypothetical protein HLB44_29240 [Aquincola sp. S2]|uniref:Uncharacterized protein n=1 Tax=Pseudaquabacterium terrae TaxID=2732868 RepID=A0ABX2ERK9_9BURK|nr:hypothetical protein [Aquabacterium terrae]NRF71094.1 hypothetical protein [Aquabacterium terrae]
MLERLASWLLDSMSRTPGGTQVIIDIHGYRIDVLDTDKLRALASRGVAA